MSKKDFIFFMLLCYTFSPIQAHQTPKIDSLKSILERDAPDSISLEAYISLGYELATYDSTSTKQYIKKGKKLATNLGDKESDLSLSFNMAYLYYMNLNYHNAIESFKTLINETDNYPKITARIFDYLGEAYWESHQYDSAIFAFEECLKYCEELGDKKLQAKILRSIGETFHIQRKYESAMEYYDQSYEAFKMLEDTIGMSRYFINMGYIYEYKGNESKAFYYYDQSLKLLTKNTTGKYNSELASLYAILGELYKFNSKLKKSLIAFKNSLGLNKQLNKPKLIAKSLMHIGDVYYDMGNNRIAMDYYSKSLKIYKEFDAMADYANILLKIAMVNNSKGNYSEAVSMCQKSININQTIDNKKGLIEGLEILSYTYRKLGKYDSAIQNNHKVLEISKAIDQLQLSSLTAIGIGYMEKHMQDSADYYFNQAYDLYNKYGQKVALMKTFSRLAEVYYRHAQHERALELYYNSLRLAEKFKDTLEIAKVYSGIAHIHSDQKNPEKALEFHNEALSYYALIGDLSSVAKTKNAIGSILKSIGNYQHANAIISESLKIYRETDNNCPASYNFQIIGQIFLLEQKFDSAFNYLIQAEKQALECDDNMALASIYIDLGKCHELTHELDKAHNIYKRALQHANKSKNQKILKEAAQALYPIYVHKREFKNAYETFKLFHESSDSLFNETNTSALIRQEMEYEHEKKLQQKALLHQQKEAELQRQKWLSYTVIAAFIALIFIFLGFYRNYRNKMKANILLQKQNLKIDKQKIALEELDHAKSRFFTNISHELRTPLTLISSPIQNLLNPNKFELQQSVAQQLYLVDRNTRKLKRIVNDILDLSKLESNKLTLNEEPTRIYSFLDRVASNFDSLAKHLEIEYSTDFVLPRTDWVLLDVDKMEKILTNLLSNALKNTNSRGHLSLFAELNKNSLLLQICDTGRGIAAKDIPQIFNRFFQNTTSYYHIEGGTGIGLALVKELTTLMGGRISVYSKLGKGSVFSIHIPYKKIDPNQLEAIKDMTTSYSYVEEYISLENIAVIEGAEEDNKEHHILIVEDHPEMQQFIKSLVFQKYHTSVAGNGNEALKLLEEKEVDLIISDIMMPEMDGYQLLQNLKESNEYRSIPVIMLTALANEDNKLKALTIGVDDYLVKPFSPQELLARVHNLILRHLKRKSWKNQQMNATIDTTDLITIKIEETETLLVTHSDIDWLKQVENVIKRELENENFYISNLASQFNLSERQFQRKIKKITGLSPKKYEQEIALQLAREMLENKTYGNPTAVAYSVGINHVSRFSKLYEARFGKRPIDYFV